MTKDFNFEGAKYLSFNPEQFKRMEEYDHFINMNCALDDIGNIELVNFDLFEMTKKCADEVKRLYKGDIQTTDVHVDYDASVKFKQLFLTAILSNVFNMDYVSDVISSCVFSKQDGYFNLRDIFKINEKTPIIFDFDDYIECYRFKANPISYTLGRIQTMFERTITGKQIYTLSDAKTKLKTAKDVIKKSLEIFEAEELLNSNSNNLLEHSEDFNNIIREVMLNN